MPRARAPWAVGCALVRFGRTWPWPVRAEIVEEGDKRIARWRLRNGQQRSGEVVDGPKGKARVRGQTKAYTARYRDGNGRMVDVPTGCSDRVAARAVLTKLERQAELVRAGVLTPAETEVASFADQSLRDHLDAYEKHLNAKGCEKRRIGMVRKRLDRVMGECKFARLNAMSAERLERWLLERADEGMAAATRNTYRESAISFGNWCRRTNRLTHNPFADVPRADQKQDRRHERRALTAEELQRLLLAARLRPLAEYGRERTPKPSDQHKPKNSRATWNREPLTYDGLDSAAEQGRRALARNPKQLAKLDRLGRERELIYKTLAMTGLRKSELASITVAQVDLESEVPHLVLNPEDEKNRQGAMIPLRHDLATEIADWL